MVAHIPGLFDLRESDLVGLAGIGQELVVVELEDKWNPVRVTACDDAQNAERRGHRVASAFDGELDDVRGIEVDGVRGKGRSPGVLDALINRENRYITGTRQSS